MRRYYTVFTITPLIFAQMTKDAFRLASLLSLKECHWGIRSKLSRFHSVPDMTNKFGFPSFRRRDANTSRRRVCVCYSEQKEGGGRKGRGGGEKEKEDEEQEEEYWISWSKEHE